MKYQHRGDFVQMTREFREKYNCTDELKWQKAHSKWNVALYDDVIEAFSEHQWSAFHYIIVQKAHVNKESHDGGYDLVMCKHFTELLTKRIIRVTRRPSHRECEFCIDVGPIVSRYDKIDKASHEIVNNIIKNVTRKEEAIKTVITKDSEESAQT